MTDETDDEPDVQIYDTDQHCPACGLPLPQEQFVALCLCPQCGTRICEGTV